MRSKLISNNILVKYEDMEEYEELEVTVIAKITSSCMIRAKKRFRSRRGQALEIFHKESLKVL